MKDDYYDFRVWLGTVLEELGRGAQSDMAVATGLSSVQITRMKNLKPKTSKDTMKITIDHYRKIVAWAKHEYSSRKLSMPTPPVLFQINDDTIRRLSLDEEYLEDEEYLNRKQLAYSSDGEYDPSIAGALPEVDVMAGAGEGFIGEIVNLKIGDFTISAHQVTDEWKFPDGYLSSVLNVSANRSLILPVIGDSMIPTYQPGDRVVVDLCQNQMTIDAVYVISDGESPPQIKRLQRVLFSSPATVDIISDNPAHNPQRVELDKLHIIGRVAGKVSKQ